MSDPTPHPDKPRAPGTPGSLDAPIPTRVVRLRDQLETGPDNIAPLAALCGIVAVLGLTCLSFSAVQAVAAAREANPGADPAAAAGQVRVTLAFVLVFFAVAATGVIGSIGTLLRRHWGRRLLIGYAVLVLLYLATAVYARLRFGIEGLTQTAPTRSALMLNLTCVGGTLIVVAVLMLVVIRYFTLPHVARRFR